MMIVLDGWSAMLVRGHTTGAKVGTLCASRNVGRRCASRFAAVDVLLPSAEETGHLRLLHEESVANTPTPARVRRHLPGVEAKAARFLVSAERSTCMFVDRLQRCSSLHKATVFHTPPASDIVAVDIDGSLELKPAVPKIVAEEPASGSLREAKGVQKACEKDFPSLDDLQPLDFR